MLHPMSFEELADEARDSSKEATLKNLYDETRSMNVLWRSVLRPAAEGGGGAGIHRASLRMPGTGGGGGGSGRAAAELREAALVGAAAAKVAVGVAQVAVGVAELRAAPANRRRARCVGVSARLRQH